MDPQIHRVLKAARGSDLISHKQSSQTAVGFSYANYLEFSAKRLAENANIMKLTLSSPPNHVQSMLISLIVHFQKNALRHKILGILMYYALLS